MINPPLYKIIKLHIRNIVDDNYDLKLTSEQIKMFSVYESDNLLFRQIRLITNNYNKFLPYIIFVDGSGFGDKKDKVEKLLKEGFYLNSVHYDMSERSASMVRTSILSFVDSSIKPQLDERVSMGLNIESCVISKYQAYRALLLSSCHILEDYKPYIVVVPDYEIVIPNQYISYVTDKITEYTDKNTGEIKTWKQKDIVQGYKDVDSIPFDGMGIHDPLITQQVKEMIGIKDNPTSLMWRGNFIKGITHELDFKQFYYENNIKTIKDMWGTNHNVDDIDIIMTKSMFKGASYFKQYGDYRDWKHYWEAFDKYNCALGISKYNYSFEEEPIYTLINYQILQTLSLEFDDFIRLADDSKALVANILDYNNPFYALCFLGLIVGNKNSSTDKYIDLIFKNQDLLKDPFIKKYLNNKLKKKVNGFKFGKLWVESCFRILCPDLIAFLEYVGGMEVRGILDFGQLWSQNENSVCSGDWLITRNPHLHYSGLAKLNGVDNKVTGKWFGHLQNICMVTSKSTIHHRLNSADYDGDLVLISNNELLLKGVQDNVPCIVDVEDKITIPPEEYTKDNIIKSILFSFTNLIGEYSNLSTCYLNKMPKTEEQKEKYLSYAALISVLTGKSIDAAKTGVIFQMPKYISKYAKPFPEFMQYINDYYARMKNFNHSNSNMNRLSRDITKWEHKFRYKWTFKDYDPSILMDSSIEFNENTFKEVEKLYLEFSKVILNLNKQNAMNKKNYYYDNYFSDLNYEQIKNTTINWDYYYTEFEKRARNICSNQKELANYAVKICYFDYPKRDKRFCWVVAFEGIKNNVNFKKGLFPIKDNNGEYEYLGRRYNMVEVESDCLTK